MPTSAISTVVAQLQGILEKHPKLKCADDVFAALNELDTMVGLSIIKEHVCKLVRTLVARQLPATGTGRQPTLLHMALLGGPGTGKTTVGALIARVVGGLRGLRKCKPPREPGASACQLPRIGSPGVVKLFAEKQRELQTLHVILANERMAHVISGTRLKQTINYHVRNMRAENAPATSIHHILAVRQAIIAATPRSVLLSPTNPNEAARPDVPKKAIFHIGTVTDLKAEYLGQSGPKTRKFLAKCFGGVAFIDEAYELFNPAYGNGDAYGQEVLGVLVDYMTRYSENLMIILAGYSDRTKAMIKQQEGLASRLAFTCEIEAYTTPELVEIFQGHLTRDSWQHLIPLDTMTSQMEAALQKGVMTNGRHAQQLAGRCVDIYTAHSFEVLLTGVPVTENKITDAMFIEACRLQAIDPLVEKLTLSHTHMYL